MKQTGWQTKRLGDVAEVSAGNSAPQNEALFKDGTYPFFRTADAGRVRFGDIYESGNYLNEKGIKGLRRYLKGTILFPKSGASTFLNHRVMLGVEGCVASHLATIVANETQIEPRFLLYFLSTVAAQDLVQDHAYPSLNLPTIADISIKVPPLPEQHRIIAILDEAFAGIATATANAESNVNNARELFDAHVQSLFFGNESGWEEKRLADVVSELVTGPFGSMLHKSDYVRNGIPVVNPQNIIGGQIVSLDKTMVSEKTKSRLERFSLRERDIVIARRGEMGRCATVNKAQAGWLCGTGSMVIRLKSGASERYIAQLLQSSTVKKNLEGNSVGTTMDNLNQDILLGLTFHLPPITEQYRITTTLEFLSTETHRLEAIYQQKLSALRELKQSILHQAFSGQLH